MRGFDRQVADVYLPLTGIFGTATPSTWSGCPISTKPIWRRWAWLRSVTELSCYAPSPNWAASPRTRPAAETLPSGQAERRQLTAMFCDLVGSTELSRRLDPEDLREVMRRYQDTVAGLVARFEGHVAKFLGDGVLAFFGWPRAYEDQAERAVRSGLAAVEAVANLKPSFFPPSRRDRRQERGQRTSAHDVQGRGGVEIERA